jgi:hypothetical protein
MEEKWIEQKLKIGPLVLLELAKWKRNRFRSLSFASKQKNLEAIPVHPNLHQVCLTVVQCSVCQKSLTRPLFNCKCV